MELAQENYAFIERTSTPCFGRSNTHNEDNHYNKFKSKLEAPMKRTTMRGVYGPTKDFITGHLDMSHAKVRPLDYTYAMAFSREFHTYLYEQDIPHAQAFVPTQHLHQPMLARMPKPLMPYISPIPTLIHPTMPMPRPMPMYYQPYYMVYQQCQQQVPMHPRQYF